jgi:signal transduction histidine kinase
MQFALPRFSLSRRIGLLWPESIAAKIHCLAAIVFLSLGGLAISAVHFASSTKLAADNVYNDGFVRLVLANNLELALESHRRIVESAPAQFDRATIEADRKSLATINKRLDELIDQAKHCLGPEGAKSLPELVAAGERVLHFAENFAHDKAVAAAEAYTALASRLQRHISVFREQRMRIADNAISQLNASANSLMHWVTIDFVAAVGLLGFFGMIITRGIASRLTRIRTVVMDLANNDTTVEVPSTSDPDEIGDIARALEVFKCNAIALIDHKRELELANVELSSFNAKLEQRVAERTRELEAANVNVTNLNVELASNIQRLKEAQDEIVRKGKLAQLGQLTATVAHEIRNPLGSVKTALYLVERKIEGKGLNLEKQLERMNNGIRRCDKIITELLDFARSKSLQQGLVPIDEWLQAVLSEEAKNLPPMVHVSGDFGLAGIKASFDPDRMRRVIINLLSNASEAMVGNGKCAGEFATRDPKIVIATRLVSKNIEITVADNGPGISDENMQRIREPLFTTKSFGVGLGLPEVEKILEHHGGGLRIKSKVGEGAAVTAWLPFEQIERTAA